MKTRPWLAYLALALASLLVYANAIQNPYLWDDVAQIQDNAALRDGANIARLASGDYYDIAAEDSLRPVKILSLFASEAAFGPSPAAQRLVNISLHAANAMLVYNLGAGWIAAGPALGGALLFALHPVHAETIDCVSYRDELLACLFGLLCLWLLRRRRPASALAAFTLALLSKENAVAVLPLALLADRLPGQPRQRLTIGRFLTAASGLSALYVILRLTVFANPEFSASYPGGSFWTNLGTMTPVLFSYLRLLAWPKWLAVGYDVPLVTSFKDPRFLLALAGLAAAAAALWRAYARDRMSFFFGAWIALALLPVLNLVPFLLYSLVFERYLYLPSVGFCLLAALWASRLPRRVLLPAAFAALTLCSWRTCRRNAEWRSALSLYAGNVALFPNSFAMRVFLGNAYRDDGNLGAAVAQYQKSLDLNPSYYSAHNALGTALHKKKDYAGAVISFRKAMSLRPKYVTAMNNLSVSYFEQGRADLALATALQSTAVKPAQSQAYENRVLFHVRAGRPEQAIAVAQEAFSRGLSSAYLHAYLGLAYAARKNTESAVAQFKAALALRPDDARLHDFLGVAHVSAGQAKAAASEFQEALRLDPRFDQPHRNLALAYLRLGRAASAEAEIDRYLALAEEGADKEAMRALKRRLAAAH